MVPDTPILKVIKEDPYIQFLTGPGFARQAWACSGCFGKNNTYIQGNNYIGCGQHVSGKEHKGIIAQAEAAEAEV